MKVAGKVVAIVAGILAFVGLVLAIFLPLMAHWGPPPKHNVALSKLKRIGVAIMLYQSDHDERNPLASQWADLLLTYTLKRTDFALPENESQSGVYGIAYMTKLGGQRSLAPKQVMLFESTDGRWNAHSNFQNVLWHKERKTAICFADTSAKAFSRNDPNVPVAGTGVSP